VIVANHLDPAHSGPQPSATRSTNTCVDCVIGFLSSRISTLIQHCTGQARCLPGKVHWNFLQPYHLQPKNLEHPGGGSLNNGRTANARSIRQRASFKVTPIRSGIRLVVPEPVVTRPRPLNRLLQALSASDYDLLQPHLQPLELVRETVLVEAGAPLTHVYLPENGIISIVIRLSEGQRIEMAMTGRDGIIGASAAFGETASLSEASVLLPGSAFMLDVANLRAAADRSAAFRALLARHEQALLAQVQQSAACNASHAVEARLSHWLLRAHELCDDQHLPLTQELLAQMIGVQRNAVSLVAHTLQQAGVISYSRGHIEINDLEGLAQTSCECYRVVKSQRDRLLNTADSRFNSND
jgi:CRP-like cAMP-binding protein